MIVFWWAREGVSGKQVLEIKNFDTVMKLIQWLSGIWPIKKLVKIAKEDC